MNVSSAKGRPQKVFVRRAAGGTFLGSHGRQTMHRAGFHRLATVATGKFSSAARLICVAAIFATGLWAIGNPARAQDSDSPSEQQLRKWLSEYPAADANRDGVLSRSEADAYRRQLQERRSQEPADDDSRHRATEFTYATMSDGVKIALAVAYPKGFDPKDEDRKWPAILQMSGYPGAAEPGSPAGYGDKYVMVHGSVRGTGASGGTIRVIGRRTGMDGHEIIENWIVKQPWSNGRVGVEGHSWPGLTGFTIAATNPPHLGAVVVSGLFDDIYRGISRIGGVRNSGFPVNWLNSLYRPTGVFGSDEAAVRLRGLSDEQYARIVASRPPRDFVGDILWKSLTHAQDMPELHEHSLKTHAAGVRAPICLMHTYQDEQTGPSGAWLFGVISENVPKRLVMSNGDHGTVGYFAQQRREWFDHWLLDEKSHEAPQPTDPQRRVLVYFETPKAESTPNRLNEPLASADFPLPETAWKRYYFHAGRAISPQPPTGVESDRPPAGDSYRVVVGVDDLQSDGVYYATAFDRPTAICGPIVVTLWITCTTLDADLFVLLMDLDAEGRAQFLQRGMLRASHRELDEKISEWAAVDGNKILIRPHHPHTDPRPLTPGKPHRLEIEVFPVGHVFRRGHRLALRISQPPLADPVAYSRKGEPSYTYASAQPPGIVTILRDADHSSSILLPILPKLPPISEQPPEVDSQAGIRWITIQP